MLKIDHKNLLVSVIVAASVVIYLDTPPILTGPVVFWISHNYLDAINDRKLEKC